eukprot:gene3506-2457_t
MICIVYFKMLLKRCIGCSYYLCDHIVYSCVLFIYGLFTLMYYAFVYLISRSYVTLVAGEGLTFVCMVVWVWLLPGFSGGVAMLYHACCWVVFSVWEASCIAIRFVLGCNLDNWWCLFPITGRCGFCRFVYDLFIVSETLVGLCGLLISVNFELSGNALFWCLQIGFDYCFAKGTPCYWIVLGGLCEDFSMQAITISAITGCYKVLFVLVDLFGFCRPYSLYGMFVVGSIIVNFNIRAMIISSTLCFALVCSFVAFYLSVLLTGNRFVVNWYTCVIVRFSNCGLRSCCLWVIDYSIGTLGLGVLLNFILFGFFICFYFDMLVTCMLVTGVSVVNDIVLCWWCDFDFVFELNAWVLFSGTILQLIATFKFRYLYCYTVAARFVIGLRYLEAIKRIYVLTFTAKVVVGVIGVIYGLMECCGVVYLLGRLLIVVDAAYFEGFSVILYNIHIIKWFFMALYICVRYAVFTVVVLLIVGYGLFCDSFVGIALWWYFDAIACVFLLVVLVELLVMVGVV